MTRSVTLHRVTGGVSVQDTGRSDYLAQGLSRGGAVDLLALAEGAALLGQAPDCAALELAGGAVTLGASCDMRLALTGTLMRASIGGVALAWNASHALPAGAKLEIAPLGAGFGYVHLGGGLLPPLVMGARSPHLAAGLGRAATSGEVIPVGPDGGDRTGLCLPDTPLEAVLRLVPGPQTALFGAAALDRLAEARFTKDARGNRMGQRLTPEGPGLASAEGLRILSEIIVPGDVQITGDGTPYVLLSECQTTGGYPRLGTVLPCDLPRLVRARPGTRFRLCLVTHPQARQAELLEAKRRAGLARLLRPILRDPREIPDLMRYQLISGVSAGDELEREVAGCASI